MVLSPLLEDYDGVILDLDGCVYVGDGATPGAARAVEALRASDRKISFVTNDPRHATEDYVRKLWGLGVQASVGDVVTVGAALQRLLAERHAGRSAFVIGTDPLRRQVIDAGLRLAEGRPGGAPAEVVIVAGTDQLSYDDLRQATLAVRAGAMFLAAGRDATYPMPDGLWPGTGAILAAVEYATGRRAEIVGKPEPALFATALERMAAGRVLAVGDRLDADVGAARRAGLDAALVLTGAATREDADAAAADPDGARPIAVADSLAHLVGVA